MNTTILVVALTISMESGGEDYAGKRAVASAIWADAHGNQAQLIPACWRPFRYSCWNKRSHTDLAIPALNNSLDRQAWSDCLELARKMVRGCFVPTFGARQVRFYQVDGLPLRSWHAGLVQVVIGRHRFFIDPFMDRGVA